MINFAIGPVQMDNEILDLGKIQIPYFRTAEFSEVMKDNERLIKKFFHAPKDSKVVFLTGSGTSAMEAAVTNSFCSEDRVIVVNGGSFGARFSEICSVFKIPHTDIILQPGESLKEHHLIPFENQGYTGFLVNLHETSTGVLYDANLIGNFCKRNHLFLIIDCISAFIADKFDMEKVGAQIALTGSQKALALPPAISVLVLDEVAVNRVNKSVYPSYYLNLRKHLKDMERGQTPFTPAVSVLLQLNRRLHSIDAIGFENEHNRIANLAKDFRGKVNSFGFSFLAQNMSNAVTALVVREGLSTQMIIDTMKECYGIWLCPNGSELGKSVFRVGHLGALTEKDNDILIAAFDDMKKKGML